MTGKNKIASYRIVSDVRGRRYQFYCDLCGALGCTTVGIKSDSSEKELEYAWETEGRHHFNRCHKCGKWVIDAMYNAEVLECVACAPYESEPDFCKFCGARIREPKRNCPQCGKPLIYEGRIDWHGA